jgi:3-dehydroquinate synthase
MKTTIRHSRGEYPVELTDLRTALASIGQDDYVVTDSNVYKATGVQGECFIAEPGEQSKSLAVYGALLEWLAHRAHRSSRVVALGGGVVGDLAGFAAATFMRGVDLVQIPTSLLAMVDSAVGGKVGIDLAAGKNLAGAFWPPVAVLVPVEALRTLPARHFTNGAAEVWKYGATLDSGLFRSLTRSPLSPDSPDIANTVLRCIELKKSVVEADERETNDRRAVLNFGHTVGHALEHALGYQGLLHGESIAIGMVVEARLANNLGIAPTETTSAIQAGLESQGLPTRLPDGLSPERLVSAMRRDKKAGRNGLAFSLVSEVGTCHIQKNVAEADVLRALEAQ